MKCQQQVWAVVLAAGDGTRLAALTTDAGGNPVPKQYCSLQGQGSLLEDAVQRAGHLVPRERLCAVVADDHRRYWQRELREFAAGNIIVQPRNCGTGMGVLLATLRVLERDPWAHLLFLPADHFVRDEPALARSLREFAALPARYTEELLLLGIEPEEPDPELGYIVPGERLAPNTHRVARFVEKPSFGTARALVNEGALWNSFIFAAKGQSLLALLRARRTDAVDSMARALAADAGATGSGRALRALYERLPSVDFSRAIVEGAEPGLRVLKAPACGWTDLGTPRRVAATLQRPLPVAIRPHSAPLTPAVVNLALQFARGSNHGWIG
ncbi:MAG TPA: sugar phosphate nucleotidyltransferase [Steroidobacteraceae bacterium]|nr:sugar phosphate nucleotidyltransferase [Steroidobacteraceae bacterium]